MLFRCKLVLFLISHLISYVVLPITAEVLSHCLSFVIVSSADSIFFLEIDAYTSMNTCHFSYNAAHFLECTRWQMYKVINSGSCMTTII